MTTGGEPSSRTPRAVIADVFARAVSELPHWRERAAAARADWAEFVELEFGAWADYLLRWQDSGDPTFRSLLVGEHVKALYDGRSDAGARRTNAVAVGAAVRQGLASLPHPGPSDRMDLQLAELYGLLGRDDVRDRRVLFVGDCLFLDIVGFVLGQAAEEGLGLIADYATSKEPSQLKDEVARFAADKRFDLVFYSPYTYEFAVDYTRTLQWRHAGAPVAHVDAIADRAAAQTDDVLATLAERFECPIYVHNSSALLREEAAWKRAAKNAVTARVRARARRRVNDALVRSLARHNKATFRHLHLVDEEALVRRAGEFRAGAYLHHSTLQHPAELGRLLSALYVDLLFVDAFLATRKVVVCDLDNTVWDGVIGEGPVEHFQHRQETLKRLRGRGVVLAINSKNDPANVHWRGGTLQADDFVFSAVSWDPKPHGMRRIQHALNLKTKDYVFLDDREDERALMQEAFPDVLCLDATRDSTWRRLALWHERLDDDVDMDRTLMYKQRDQREAFVQEETREREAGDLFAKLDLSVEIYPADAADLKRVVELINRTSQFNLEGSRVTFPQVRRWFDDPSKHLILLGRTADRFGTMGVTCICIVGLDGSTMTLLPFVLSCRVFGYGIETAVLNHLRRAASQTGIRTIVGRYTATPQNGPCKDFLPLNGFVQSGDRWVLDLADDAIAIRPTPSWLRVVEPDDALAR